MRAPGKGEKLHWSTWLSLDGQHLWSPQRASQAFLWVPMTGSPSRWEVTVRKHPLSQLLLGGLLGGRGCFGSENHSSCWPPSAATAHSLESLLLPTGHPTLLVSPFYTFGIRPFINLCFRTHVGPPRWCSGKECACHCRRSKRHGFYP